MGRDIRTDLSPYSTSDTFGISDVRKVLTKYAGKKCLDIGCGILPRPAYMIEGVEFSGIDPLKGGKREFEFIQSDGEKLPFDCGIFDSVLFGTSIDHLKDPTQVIREAQRVLKPGGYVIIWLGIRPREKYNKWIKRGGWYNDLHPWAFTKKSLAELLSEFQMIEEVNIKWNDYIFIFQCTE